MVLWYFNQVQCGGYLNQCDCGVGFKEEHCLVS